MTLTAHSHSPALDTADSGAATRLEDVTRSFGATPVLRGLDLRIGAGEIVSLIGRSGSGKSTALRLLAGLDDDAGGRILLFGNPSVVFQSPSLLPWRTVAGNVAHGLNQIDISPAAKAERVAGTLAEVGLGKHSGAYPGELSGGQAQRASLARALVGAPELLLLDEPFSALDAITRHTMHGLLLSLWRHHGFGILLVTHDVDEAVALSDRVDVLVDGRVAHSERIEFSRAEEPDPRHKAGLLEHLGVQA